MKDMNVSGSSQQRRAGDNEPETVSDAEEEEEARAAEDDDDSDDEAAPRAEADEGLSQRYQEALSESQHAPSDQDFSFARYLRANNIQ